MRAARSQTREPGRRSTRGRSGKCDGPAPSFATHALPSLRLVHEVPGYAWVTAAQSLCHLGIEDLQAQLVDLPGNGRGPAAGPPAP
jgi:hypothetical protein